MSIESEIQSRWEEASEKTLASVQDLPLKMCPFKSLLDKFAFNLVKNETLVTSAEATQSKGTLPFQRESGVKII